MESREVQESKRQILDLKEQILDLKEQILDLKSRSRKKRMGSKYRWKYKIDLLM